MSMLCKKVKEFLPTNEKDSYSQKKLKTNQREILEQMRYRKNKTLLR